MEEGGMHPWCSADCEAKWKTRNNFLFFLNERDLKKATWSISGEQVLGLVMQRGWLDNDPSTLSQVSEVSTAVRPLAMEHEVGSEFHKEAVHMQQRGTKEVLDRVKVSVKKTGKKITVEKTDVKGRKFKRVVDETVEERIPIYKTVPNIIKVDITADQMLEIALMAYNTAIELKEKNLPVILYRVSSKGTLTSEEKKKQTLSSSVHASVGGTEVWPLQKTAAWIQGAMRARVSFVLLNDPRGDDILIGGINKASDAVYVRELHQITCMKYQIKQATAAQTPKNLRGKTKLFCLEPPEESLGPLPLVPRVNASVDWSHTWDSSKSNLTLGAEPTLIRDHLRQMFVDAGKNLSLPLY
ncbi:MAG: hypothetical protein JO015_21905 [Verrucomicrobia bacterium]|nr:hypothetical protein [Verrucomicrobiota bacterium]